MEKKSKFKTIIKMVKRFLQTEKERAEFKKRKKNSSIKPKGFVSRKLGVTSFWVMFGFMFLVVLVTMFSGNSSEANSNKDVLPPDKNQAASLEAVQFAENFAKDYFTWNLTDKDKVNRKEKMQAYLAQGIDQNAGLDYTGLEWDSNYRSSELKKIEEEGNDIAHITLLVNFELSQGDGEKKKVKQSQKYFVVPVAFDGETFGVYELPKFTYIYENTTLKEVKSERLKQADVKESEKIKAFLDTFFRSFAEDSKDKLNYILTDEKIADGLNQTMLFEQVNKSNVFKDPVEDNSFVVFTEVRLIEPETNIPFLVNYQLTVLKKDGKYIVSGIDDQKNKVVESIEVEEDEEIDEEVE
ncbi:conjugal transfer protein [Cytobacillus horneckiae]|uniref:Conjugal transfer protein n=1 Tax=Cytobacillus horneckiae TaxID=549687 RepID=A0A2N0ZAZ2_9BACI|nr:conjugal transfer protein [Cytobacillus horneckiae]MEC1158703.1 conjugal transfer protein [Cytobacillus horneckiae]NRG46661.1 conjugal transfer protein [Bacillus sp. CRN 9]PKG26687.1 hypothetical protein CWS20_22835 [Cytobacillus horneckiae]